MDELSHTNIDAGKTVAAKTNESNGQNQGANAAIACVEEYRPPIFKLHIYCYEALADWLSLEELHAFGQTCDRLQKAAGYIFRETYPAARANCEKNGIYIGGIQVNGFCDYIQSLTIRVDDPECFRFIESNNFSSVEKINVSGIHLTAEKIDCIKKILHKAETVEVVDCILDGEFHDNFLQYCGKLNRLKLIPKFLRKKYINDSGEEDLDFIGPAIMIGENNDWMFHVYPKLEHFELMHTGHSSGQTPKQLSTFLQQNSSIRNFATSADLLDEDILFNLKSKLEVFAMDLDEDIPTDNKYYLLEKVSKLQETQCFYKHLHINSVDYWDFLTSISKIQKLTMHYYGDLIDTIPENSLEGLIIFRGPAWVEYSDETLKNIHDQRMKMIDNNPNIERVFLVDGTIDDILSFVGGSAKLSKLGIKRSHHLQCLGLDQKILDLSAMNNFRANLPRAEKVTIYVEEDVYLSTKWATHKTDYSLVELKRIESYDWHHNFIEDHYY